MSETTVNPTRWGAHAVVQRAQQTGRYAGPVSSLTPANQVPSSETGHVVIRLRELMLARGLISGPKAPRAYRGQPSIAGLARMTGLSRDKCWQLLNHPSTMRHFSFSTIAAICHAFKCQPGDFLAWQPSFTSYDRVMGMVTDDLLSTKYGMGLTPRAAVEREDRERGARRGRVPPLGLDTDAEVTNPP